MIKVGDFLHVGYLFGIPPTDTIYQQMHTLMDLQLTDQAKLINLINEYLQE